MHENHEREVKWVCDHEQLCFHVSCSASFSSLCPSSFALLNLHCSMFYARTWRALWFFWQNYRPAIVFSSFRKEKRNQRRRRVLFNSQLKNRVHSRLVCCENTRDFVIALLNVCIHRSVPSENKGSFDVTVNPASPGECCRQSVERKSTREEACGSSRSASVGPRAWRQEITSPDVRSFGFRTQRFSEALV